MTTPAAAPDSAPDTAPDTAADGGAQAPTESIGVTGVTVRFGRTTALRDVSLDAHPGQVTAIVGGDGAGKSTLLRVLAGRVRAETGQVRTVERARFGYQPSTSGVWPTLTVDENLEFTGRSYGMSASDIRTRSAELLERAGLEGARRRLGHALSGGMRQKLGFVLAILHEPELVLLDEPSTGVDPVSRVELWRLISATATMRNSATGKGTTIVMATTYLDEAQRAPHVLALDSGRVLAFGTPEAIVASLPGTIYRLPDADALHDEDAGRTWRRGNERRLWVPAVDAAGAADARDARHAHEALDAGGVRTEAQDDAQGDVVLPRRHGKHSAASITSQPGAGSGPGAERAATPIARPDFEDALIALSLAAAPADDGPDPDRQESGRSGSAASTPHSAEAETPRRRSSARRRASGPEGLSAGRPGAGPGAGRPGPGRPAPGPGTESPRVAGSSPTSSAVASARHVVKTFGSTRALDDVGLEVHAGEVVGLIGANGAGKTTLLRILLGLERADEGELRLFGEPPANSSRRRLGYVPQGLGLYTTLSVRENVAFLSRVYDLPRPDLPQPLQEVRSDVVADIGLGRQRQLAFVLALAHEPELLVLDEPTSGVDPLARARLWDVIHEQADAGRAVIVTTHYLQEAEQCTRLVLLSQGRMVGTGSVGDLTRGAAAVLVTSDEWQRAFDALDRSGMPIMLSGRGIRVAGDARAPGGVERLRERVLDALRGIRVDVRPVPATLEETMVLLDHDADDAHDAARGTAA
jgi:ABC-2 type transport system ATP-binding protein